MNNSKIATAIKEWFDAEKLGRTRQESLAASDAINKMIAKVRKPSKLCYDWADWDDFVRQSADIQHCLRTNHSMQIQELVDYSLCYGKASV